jgi:hypothetical protein
MWSRWSVNHVQSDLQKVRPDFKNELRARKHKHFTITVEASESECILKGEVLHGSAVGAAEVSSTPFVGQDPQLCVTECLPRACRLPLPPSTLLTKSLSLWKLELENDHNVDFLIDGLTYCFMIIDRVCTIENVFRRNYRCVLCDSRVKVEERILKEVHLGRYIVVKKQPSLVSSLFTSMYT